MVLTYFLLVLVCSFAQNEGGFNYSEKFEVNDCPYKIEVEYKESWHEAKVRIFKHAHNKTEWIYTQRYLIPSNNFDKFSEIQIYDFNSDGFKDILVSFEHFADGTFEYLYLFDNVTDKFKEVKNYWSISGGGGTSKVVNVKNLYFTFRYDTSCQGDFESELLFFEGNKIIYLGSIEGKTQKSCEYPGIIKIYKNSGSNLQTYATISEGILEKYNLSPYQYIETYWNHNHLKFTK